MEGTWRSTEVGTEAAPPMESEDVNTAFDHTLKDASSFAHQVHHCVMLKTKASPARVRKISLSEQAIITEAFQ
eukprot:1652928-Amphidinium_carterae.2